MDIKQKQHLLAYLGYYTMEVDGIWGAGSEAATREFQEDYGLDADGIFGPVTEAKIKEVIATGEEPKQPVDPWEGIKHFTRDEFKCKCGKYCDGHPVEVKAELLKNADRVREYFNSPVIISSGVRCKQHNANVGGVEDSRHLQGKAMDFCVSGKSASEVLAYAQKQPEIRYAYAIDKNYIHMDIE